MNAVSACPICRSSNLADFVDRRDVPTQQNVIYRSRAEAQAVPRGHLLLASCRTCGFVFNRAFQSSEAGYGTRYDNRQECSPTFNRYLDGLIRRIAEVHGPGIAHAIEVGCGKGEFIKRLVMQPDGEYTGIGFDPTYVGPEMVLDGRLRYQRTNFGGTGGLSADAIICRHVIEHVPDPLALLSEMRAALSESEGARIYLETPDVEWILRGSVTWDLFYEHCSYFSEGSLREALRRVGLIAERFDRMFGSQYLWIEARSGHTDQGASSGTEVPALARAFAQGEVARNRDLLAILRRYHGVGRVAIWGAGAKGVTFLNELDPNCELVACAVDVNPAKQGGFVPGTGHPIVSFNELRNQQVRFVYPMNPNYRNEIETMAQASGSLLQVI